MAGHTDVEPTPTIHLHLDQLDMNGMSSNECVFGLLTPRGVEADA